MRLLVEGFQAGLPLLGLRGLCLCHDNGDDFGGNDIEDDSDILLKLLKIKKSKMIFHKFHSNTGVVFYEQFLL